MQQRFTDGNHMVVVDDAYAPIYIATFFGESTDKTIRELFAWNRQLYEQVAQQRQQFVFITDATDATRPTPKVRSLIVELSDALPPSPYNVGNYIVLSNALVRGAFTAMQWLTRREWRTITAASCAEAIQLSSDALLRAGAKIPPHVKPESYQRPRR